MGMAKYFRLIKRPFPNPWIRLWLEVLNGANIILSASVNGLIGKHMGILSLSMGILAGHGDSR